MNLTVKYAEQPELIAIHDLFSEVLHQLKYYNPAAKKSERAKFTLPQLEEKLLKDPFSIIVVKIDNEVVGFCFNRFDDYTVWLEWFGVAQSARNKKVGSILLAELENSARQRECHKVWCDSRTENIESFKTLQKNGFVVMTTLLNHWHGQDYFIWQKMLG